MFSGKAEFYPTVLTIKAAGSSKMLVPLLTNYTPSLLRRM
jgi:hypothetical protein